MAALAFSGDGKTLAIVRALPRVAKRGAGDEPPPRGGVRLWQVDGKAESRAIEKVIENGTEVTFTPDGRHLALGCADGSIRLIEVATGKEARNWSTPDGPVSALVFSPDGKVLFSSGKEASGVRRWDAATGREINGDDDHTKPVTRLRFHADGKTLVSLGSDQRVIHWDLATRSPSARQWTGRIRERVSVLGPEGKFVAHAYDLALPGAKGQLGVYDARTGGRQQLLEGYLWDTTGMAFDHQGKRLAWTGSITGEVRLRDLADSKCVWQTGVRVPGAIQQASSPLCFSRDGRLLVVGGYEPVVHLLDAATGKPLHRFEYVKEDNYAPAFAADFSPDGQLVAFPTNWRDTPIVLLETRTGKVRHTWRSGQNGGAAFVEFSPDGRLLATASHYDHSVKLWDVATGKEVASFASPARGIVAGAFSPDGRTLATGCADSTILLWDVTAGGPKAGKPLAAKHLGELWDALADADAKKAYAATWEMALSADGAVPFLRERLALVKPADAALVDRLVKQLGADDYTAREKATRELKKLGGAAIGRLRQALAAADLEARRRIEAVIASYRRGDEWERQRQALAALERGGSLAARKRIEELARGAEGALLTEEARAILARWQ